MSLYVQGEYHQSWSIAWLGHANHHLWKLQLAPPYVKGTCHLHSTRQMSISGPNFLICLILHPIPFDSWYGLVQLTIVAKIMAGILHIMERTLQMAHTDITVHASDDQLSDSVLLWVAWVVHTGGFATTGIIMFVIDFAVLPSIQSRGVQKNIPGHQSNW